jgi:predicted permease
LTLALRRLAASPAFTAVAVVTLAVAIAVNSAVFSIINSVLLRPPVADKPDEVVCLYTASRDARREFRQFSFVEYRALQSSTEVFKGIAAVNFNYVGVGQPDSLRRCLAFMVSDNFFELMAIRPAAGRFFTREEARPGAGQRVVIASYGLWQRYGGRHDFVGSTLSVNGRPHTVIGVSPEGPSGISALIAPELWLPFGLYAEAAPAFSQARTSGDPWDPKNFTVSLIGRMQPGLTLESARARLPSLADRLMAVQPPGATIARDLVIARPFGVSPMPVDPGPLRLIGLLLLGMSAAVLGIACLNLANMMLARSASRTREIAVRLAIGASRYRLVRQLVAEGLVLAGAGGALGLCLSLWANGLLRSAFFALLHARGFTLTASIRPDIRVVAATFAVGLLATLIFSLGPALRATRVDLVRGLKTQAGGSDATGAWRHFFSGRHVMVMAQITVSLALVFTACLFVRAALDASGRSRDAGFTTAGVTVAELDFSLRGTTRPEAMRRLAAAVGRVRALPGVRTVSISSLVPYTDAITPVRVKAAESPNAAGRMAETEEGVGAIYSSVTAGYFDTIGVPLIRGRDFTEGESLEDLPSRVCIVDDGLARRLYRGGDALGRRVRFAEASIGAAPMEFEIVGIVGRHAHGMQDKGSPVPGIYVPFGQAFTPAVYLSVRRAVEDPRAETQAAAELRETLRRIDFDLPIVQALPFGVFVENNLSVWMMRLGATMFGLFGGVALLLATVGVYGVKAHAVACRTREIGIRMALGAARRDVFSLVMAQGLQQAAVALGAGVALSLATGRVLYSVFPEVASFDGRALGAAVALLAAAAVSACSLPARRATSVDPITALRSE